MFNKYKICFQLVSIQLHVRVVAVDKKFPKLPKTANLICFYNYHKRESQTRTISDYIKKSTTATAVSTIKTNNLCTATLQIIWGQFEFRMFRVQRLYLSSMMATAAVSGPQTHRGKNALLNTSTLMSIRTDNSLDMIHSNRLTD